MKDDQWNEEMERKLDALSASVIHLRWQKEYDKALRLYKTEIFPAFNKHLLPCNLVSAIADCLRETHQTAAAIEFVTVYLGLRGFYTYLDKKFLINLTWLYCHALKPEAKFKYGSTHPQHLEMIASLVIKMSELNEGKLQNLLFFRYIDWLTAQNEPHWQEVVEMTNRIGAAQFSEEAEVITIEGKSKAIELAGPKEKWFMFRIKAFYTLNQYDDCIVACKEAFDADMKRFHYGNQIWISRYLARCYMQTGRIKEAIHGFERILKRKNDWFLQKELADLYLQDNQTERAIELTTDACMNGGHTHYKVGLYELLGNIHDKNNQPKEANDWRCLAIAVRLEQNWTIPTSLRAVDYKPSSGMTAQNHYNQLIKSLKGNLSEKAKFPKQNPLHETGVITRILHPEENGDGFITTSDERSVYFRFSQTKINAAEIVVGLEVSFKAIENEHKGKKLWRALSVYKV